MQQQITEEKPLYFRAELGENIGINTVTGRGFKSGDTLYITCAETIINKKTIKLTKIADTYAVFRSTEVESEISLNGKTLKLERRVPVLDYVCVSGNRLWGCRYGASNLAEPDGVPREYFPGGSGMVNEIRCCAVGDLDNWEAFEGSSMDSYAVSVGDVGKFTAAVAYGNYPRFFKENHMYTVSGATPASYTVTNHKCLGVQDGSWRSCTVCNGALYYKSYAEIVRYDGSEHKPITTKLGTTYTNGHYIGIASGSHRTEVYMWMRDTDTGRNQEYLYSYDTQRGIWHMIDTENIWNFACNERGVYFTQPDDETGGYDLLALGSVQDIKSNGSTEQVKWHATFGAYGYDVIENKYLTRYEVRLQMDEGTKIRMDVMYDSDGVWRPEGFFIGKTIRSFTVPVVMRRCDHCQLRLSGEGSCRILSVSRIMERGSDY